VVPGAQELCLPYELCAADIDEAEPLSIMLLVTYLFTALPQLLPRATLDFSCKLGDQQVCCCNVCSGRLPLKECWRQTLDGSLCTCPCNLKKAQSTCGK
jgi:hypothetical protein